MSAFAGWSHCPRCTGLLGDGVDTDGQTRLHCPRCGLVLYDNPAPTAGAIVTRPGGEVLLVRRAREPAAGMLDVPGGFVERGETGEQTVVRELLEETGYHIMTTGFVGAFPDTYGDGVATFNLYYTAVVRGGTEHAADDVSEIVWTAPGALPPREQIAFANVADAIELGLGVELPRNL